MENNTSPIIYNGEQIKHLRRLYNISRRELAAESGITILKITDIEDKKPENKIELKTLHALLIGIKRAARKGANQNNN